MLDLLEEIRDRQSEDRCIVRISTSSWRDKRGIHIRKDINYLRKLCIGYNVLEEDSYQVDLSDIIDRILNLYEVEDGIYEIIICNESRDYETGYIDDYDYKLVAFAN